MKKISTLFAVSLVTFASSWAQGPETKVLTKSEFYDAKDPITDLSQIKEGNYYIFHNRNRNCHVYEAEGGRMKMGLPGSISASTVGDVSYTWKANISQNVNDIPDANGQTTLYSFSSVSNKYVPVVNSSGNIVTTDGDHKGRFLIKDKVTDGQVKYWILRNEKPTVNSGKSTYYNWNGNASGGTFNGWDDEGGNSQYSIIPVSVRSVSKTYVNVQYNFNVEGDKTYTVKVWQEENSNFSVPAVSAQVTILSKDCEGKKVSTENYIANIECSIKNLPFIVSTEGDQHPTYLLLNPTAKTDTWKVQDENTRLKKVKAYNNQKFSQSELNQVLNDLWTVSGDAFNGFVFKNVGTGNILSADITNGNAGTPKVVEDNERCDDVNLVRTWRLGYGQNGENNLDQFALTPNKATAKFINQNSAIDSYSFGYWNADGGSTFFVAEPTIEIAMNPVGDKSYSTMCLPYDFAVASTDVNTKLFKASSVSSNVMKCESVEGVPAKQGVIIKNDEGASTATLVVKKAEKFDGNLLQGTTEVIPFAQLSDKLVFGTNAGVVGFFKAGGSADLGANKAYLPLDQAKSNKLSLDFGDGETTGIFELETESNTSSAIYDMSGRRVNTIQKGGIYIQNGKKIIVK